MGDGVGVGPAGGQGGESTDDEERVDTPTGTRERRAVRRKVGSTRDALGPKVGFTSDALGPKVGSDPSVAHAEDGAATGDGREE